MIHPAQQAIFESIANHLTGDRRARQFLDNALAYGARVPGAHAHAYIDTALHRLLGDTDAAAAD